MPAASEVVDGAWEIKGGGVHMKTNNLLSGTVGWMAIVAGIAAILAFIFIIVFFSAGEPFGTINDVFNGLFAIVSAVLAWRIFLEYPVRPISINQIGLLLAAAGAVIAVTGSALVIFKITGWVLAGFYTGVGDALIGVWLAAFCYSILREGVLPHNLTRFGLTAGVLMALGLISLLGIVWKIDSMDAMPWYLNLGYFGFFGTYFLYPVWAIWLGRALLSK